MSYEVYSVGIKKTVFSFTLLFLNFPKTVPLPDWFGLSIQFSFNGTKHVSKTNLIHVVLVLVVDTFTKSFSTLNY